MLHKDKNSPEGKHPPLKTTEFGFTGDTDADRSQGDKETLFAEFPQDWL